MNDRHPSGTMTTPAPASDAASAHYASYGTQEAQYGDFTTYGGYDASGFPTGAHATATFAADPLFGNLPGDATGSYDTGNWPTGDHQSPHYDAYAAQHAAYGTGAYETTAWTGEYQQLSAIPPQTTGNDTSGHWDASAWLQPDQAAAANDRTQQWEWGTQAFDTGAYDATQWNSDGEAPAAGEPFGRQATAVFEQVEHGGYADHSKDGYEDHSQDGYEEHQQDGYAEHPHDGYEEQPHADGELTATGELPAVTPLLDDQEETTPAPASRAAARNASRSRRRTPPKRSALLTIAVPSACVMGVAGIAAASVGTFSSDDGAATASAAQAVKPAAANNKLDSQLESLSAGADDFADRASRTQERIDLKTQQEAEKKKAAAEAARKERLRPKYALPVAQRGLSAYFGQAGVNWMSVHTGIDFPVSYGTTVMAATDGTVRTQWNSAYGNMLILTAKDGTETWYCHLSSYRVPSGTTVKAGQPIAYSGNSGNSTGPHLHFEVHPAGGAAIDPLPWLRSHGLDPT
ncbi:M23 family metallopeptidase [Streptomyces sp. CdTB01]|uniref:M23 family metallopeptidase n=1 Tax=Streptomyces sp. CdTB01 TaxID=1725411 RepID=UPI00073A8FC2|nr:M23 family metallopeptidase [Streptomyces sp. CdTB01]ALV34030.1 peptidase M23 [Streptomyces sp. CdTB01]